MSIEKDITGVKQLFEDDFKGADRDEVEDRQKKDREEVFRKFKPGVRVGYYQGISGTYGPDVTEEEIMAFHQDHYIKGTVVRVEWAAGVVVLFDGFSGEDGETIINPDNLKILEESVNEDDFKGADDAEVESRRTEEEKQNDLELKKVERQFPIGTRVNYWSRGARDGRAGKPYYKATVVGVEGRGGGERRGRTFEVLVAIKLDKVHGTTTPWPWWLQNPNGELLTLSNHLSESVNEDDFKGADDAEVESRKIELEKQETIEFKKAAHQFPAGTRVGYRVEDGIGVRERDYKATVIDVYWSTVCHLALITIKLDKMDGIDWPYWADNGVVEDLGAEELKILDEAVNEDDFKGADDKEVASRRADAKKQHEKEFKRIESKFPVGTRVGYLTVGLEGVGQNYTATVTNVLRSGVAEGVIIAIKLDKMDGIDFPGWTWGDDEAEVYAYPEWVTILDESVNEDDFKGANRDEVDRRKEAEENKIKSQFPVGTRVVYNHREMKFDNSGPYSNWHWHDNYIAGTVTGLDFREVTLSQGVEVKFDTNVKLRSDGDERFTVFFVDPFDDLKVLEESINEDDFKGADKDELLNRRGFNKDSAEDIRKVMMADKDYAKELDDKYPGVRSIMAEEEIMKVVADKSGFSYEFVHQVYDMMYALLRVVTHSGSGLDLNELTWDEWVEGVVNYSLMIDDDIDEAINEDDFKGADDKELKQRRDDLEREQLANAGEWVLIAKRELEARLEVITSIADVWDDHFTLMADEGKGNNGESEWTIYNNENAAEIYAIEYVENQLEDSPEMFNQSWMEKYITLTDTDRSMLADDESSSRIEWMGVDQILDDSGKRDEYDELQEQIDELEDTENAEEIERLEGELQQLIDDGKEELRDKNYEEIYDALEYPVDYFVHETGMYSLEDLLQASFISIDTEEAAGDAVSEDGIAHFIDYYDGEEVDLPSGAIAYGTN